MATYVVSTSANKKLHKIVLAAWCSNMQPLWHWKFQTKYL